MPTFRKKNVLSPSSALNINGEHIKIWKEMVDDLLKISFLLCFRVSSKWGLKIEISRYGQ
jgi:hypothetical protein